MKKLIFVFLFFYSFSCYANWQLIDKNSQFELYVNSNTLVKTTQGYRFIWLYSYYKENRLGTKREGYYYYQSFGFDEEINCVTKESRLFSSSPFSGPMGVGLIKTNSMNAQWKSVFDKNKGVGIQTIFAKLCK